jgi:hypothetical protein
VLSTRGEIPAESEQMLEGLMNFERYRSILEAARVGLPESKHIEKCDQIIALKLFNMEGTLEERKNEMKNLDIPNKSAAIGFNYNGDDGIGSRLNDDGSESGGSSGEDDNEVDDFLELKLEGVPSEHVLSEAELQSLADSFAVCEYQSISEFAQAQAEREAERREVGNARTS